MVITDGTRGGALSIDLNERQVKLMLTLKKKIKYAEPVLAGTQSAGG